MATTTFLQLCKNVCREAGVAQGEGAISSVTGQVGLLSRVVNYVNQEWVKLQNRHQSTGQHWRWMRGEFTLLTVADQELYDYTDATDDETGLAISSFRNWMFRSDCDPAKIYLQSAGQGTQTWMSFIDWNDFKYLYRNGAQQPGYPAHISINDKNQIALGAKPNDVYVVKGDYMKAASKMVADGDTPDIPEAFVDVITFGALSRYGLYENASEVVTYAQDELATLLGDLECDQLSEIPIAGPLA